MAQNDINQQLKRRGSGRFQLRAHATVNSDGENWPAHLINFSIDGALIAVTEKHNMQTGSAVELKIELNENQHIKLQGQVVHVKKHYLGVKCKAQNFEDEALLNELIEKFRSGKPVTAKY